MYRDMERYGKDPRKITRSKTTFGDPLKWKDGRLIFTCSWSDFMIQEADGWRGDAWQIIRDTERHTYQILTKRTERIPQCLPSDWGDGYRNVWLGTSVESPDYKDRIDELRIIPAHVRFLSIEPLIQDIGALNLNGIHWVIIGGESGPQSREFKIQWARDIVQQCAVARVACYVKQLGAKPTIFEPTLGQNRPLVFARHGSPSDHANVSWDAWPEDLRVRQYPEVRS